MSALSSIAAASWLEGLGLTGEGALLLPVSLALLALCVVLVIILVSGRRRTVKETREIVGTLEEIRSGRPRRRAEVPRGSPLAMVADSLNRLGQDFESRLTDAENAAERLHAVQDAVRSSAVVTTDTDGDIRSFSPGSSVLFGWDEEEVLTKPASLLFDEQAYQQFLPKLARRDLREKGIDSRAVLLRRDGTSFPADVSVRVLRNAAKESIGFVIVIRDVTRQAALEQELKEAEARYRCLVEGLGDGVLIVRDGDVLFVNPAFASLCGAVAQQLEGTRLRERIATGDVLIVEESLAAVQRRRKTQEQLRCSVLGREAGTHLQVTLTAAAIEYLGKPAVLLLVRDETPERRVEAELRRNESQLDAVVESASDGILVMTEGRDGGVVRMTNAAFADLLGLGRKEILGLSLGNLVRVLSERGGGARRLAGLLAQGDGIEGETIVIGGKPTREIQVFLAPLRDRRGELLGRVLACRDRTRELESQRKLQQHAEELQLSKVMLEKAYRRLDAANKNLHERGEELDRLNRELRTLDEMKSNLLGNVSHELQTPLVSIRGYTEMTIKERLGPITEEQRKGLSLCLKNIDRLISMIDNLLAFSRSEPDLGDLTLSRFPLQDLVDEAAALLRQKMQARAIRFSARVEPADLTVQADRDKILQVFLNLISNAVKFNRQGGRIDVDARPDNRGFAQVQVEDTGVGISPAEVEKIFERNYQAGARSSTREEGSGIGLAIVRDVLRLHGCRISVHSEEERGTRFTLTLPISTDRRADAETNESVEADPERPAVQPTTASAPGDDAVSPAAARPEAVDRMWEPVPDESPPPDAAGEARKPRFRIIRRREF